MWAMCPAWSRMTTRVFGIALAARSRFELEARRPDAVTRLIQIGLCPTKNSRKWSMVGSKPASIKLLRRACITVRATSSGAAEFAEP